MSAFLRAAIVVAQLLVVCVVTGAGAQPVPNDPPQIVFSPSPAILILIDGDPVYRTVDGTDLQLIVNTRSLIVRNAAGIYYLKLRKGWMESYLLTGWWTRSGTAPEGGAEAIRQAVNDKAVDLLNGHDVPDTDAGPLPTVYVYTTPAVLIVTDGPPALRPTRGNTASVHREHARGCPRRSGWLPLCADVRALVPCARCQRSLAVRPEHRSARRVCAHSR